MHFFWNTRTSSKRKSGGVAWLYIMLVRCFTKHFAPQRHCCEEQTWNRGGRGKPCHALDWQIPKISSCWQRVLFLSKTTGRMCMRFLMCKVRHFFFFFFTSRKTTWQHYFLPATWQQTGCDFAFSTNLTLVWKKTTCLYERSMFGYTYCLGKRIGASH